MLETWSHEGPQCPHCKRQFTADEPHYYDVQYYTEETCDDCGKTFDVEVQSTVAWACTQRENPHD